MDLLSARTANLKVVGGGAGSEQNESWFARYGIQGRLRQYPRFAELQAQERTGQQLQGGYDYRPLCQTDDTLEPFDDVARRSDVLILCTRRNFYKNADFQGKPIINVRDFLQNANSNLTHSMAGLLA